MSSNKNESELRAAVERDPASPEFVELARLVSEAEGGNPEAREILFRGLTADPKNALGRLLLARLFYLDGMSAFAVRELAELQKIHDVPALSRLIDAFGEFADSYREAPVVSAPSATVAHVHTDSGRTSGGPEDDVVLGEVDIEADFDEVEDQLEK